MAAQSVRIPLANKEYLYLVAANIGAVIMPWMVFYQQSAVADKKLKPEHFNAARVDTAVGAVVTQLVMAAVLVAAAATIAVHHGGAQLATVGDLSSALTPYLGVTVGKLVFGLGIIGAGMVAAIVASLALAWGLGEVTGYKHSLEYRPLEARWFYLVYAVSIVGGCVLVALSPEPRVPERRRAGDERPAAADRARVSDRPGGEGAAGTCPPQGLVSVAGDRGGRRHLRARRVRRIHRSGRELISAGGVRASAADPLRPRTPISDAARLDRGVRDRSAFRTAGRRSAASPPSA